MNWTTVVLDFSVACHQLHSNILEAAVERTHYEGVIKAQMQWMMSLDWLGSLKPDPDKTQVILAMDTKVGGRYWRHEYLERPAVFEKVWAANKSARAKKAAEPIAYKAGRKFPEKSFTKLKKDMEKVAVERGWQMLRMPSYEADDIAASIVATNRALPSDRQHKVILGTIDSDWIGMVGDDCGWMCMYGWSPRVRFNLDQINTWASRRLKTTFAQPKDLWVYKTEHGDKSDNLPKNSPQEVIDLLNPPEEHKLWQQPAFKGVLTKLMTEPKPLPVIDPTKATEYLRQLGVAKFIKPYTE